MFRFFESIKVINKNAQNLFFHQKRVNETFLQFFTNHQPFDLELVISKLIFKDDSCYKLRISYTEKIENIDCTLYFPKIHQKFQLIKISNLDDYSFKSENRGWINKLTSNVEFEPIFIKNEKITEVSYANILFLKAEQWFTPKNYLLNGTKRQLLLKENKIQELEITEENLFQFTHFKLINAMLDFEESQMYSIEQIINS